MNNRKPRADEQAALDVILALEDVAHHEWLPESHIRTPDLRLVLRGGRVITVEVTLATGDADRRLRAAAETMRPRCARELSYEWTVHVSDHDIATRHPSRTLKDYVAQLICVLADVEDGGGTPAEMQRRAELLLDADSYNPFVSRRRGGAAPWHLAFDPEAGEWNRELLVEFCDYWFPLDIVDRIIDNVEPRRVGILRPPAPSALGGGSINVYAGGMEPAFIVTGVEYLVAALEQAIEKKAARGQMANASGEKWLVVALDGNNAAGQLEGAFEPEAQTPHPDLSEIQFAAFDEVWALAKTFHGKKLVVLRLSKPPSAPQFYTVPRP